MKAGYRTLLHLPACSSTQDYLQDSDLPAWSVVWADQQDSGRGRKQRDWKSPPGGLYYSFCYPFEVVEVPPALQLMGAALVWKEILSEAVDREMEFNLKWPNDLLCQGRKIGGMIAMTRDWKIDLGIGLNINNSFGPDLSGYRRTPISMSGAVGHKFSRYELLSRWLKKFIGALLNGTSNYFSSREIQKHIETIGQRVRANGKEGEAVGIHKTGALVLAVGGEVELVYAGDVQEVKYL